MTTTDGGTVLVPELVLDERGVRRGRALELRDGRIARELDTAEAGPTAQRLPGLALAPGFVNVHSHAFQRDLRGRVEHVSPEGGADDFWSWRTAMYEAANRHDPASMHDVALRCFREMRRAGYTTVGEFHYVHHERDGRSYDRPNALAETVCAAAEEAGLRIVLLLTAYARAGAGRPPQPEQRRFCDAGVEGYLERLDALRGWAVDRPLVTVGTAPHSVRAVPRDWLEAIAAHADRHALPLHVHADEQPREIEECLAEHGLRPVALLDAVGALGPLTTVIHGTHCDDAEIELLAERGTTVGVCPTTEANLGDGYAPVERLWRAGVALTVGSDSNVRIDPFEELRELELMARRSGLRRNVLVAPDADGPAPALLQAGWANGRRALGSEGGPFEDGPPADLVALDLDDPEIAGVADEDLAAAIVFAGSARLVVRSWVNGHEHPEAHGRAPLS